MDHAPLGREREVQLPRSARDQQHIARRRLLDPSKRLPQHGGGPRHVTAAGRIPLRHRDAVRPSDQPDTVEPLLGDTPLPPEPTPDRTARPPDRAHPPG